LEAAMDRKRIAQQLRRDEGEILHVYPDSLGYWSIGVGRLLDKRRGGGITPEESEYLLNNDITRKSGELDYRLPWWRDLDEARQGVILNMAFQLGVDGLLSFKNTLEYVRTKQYKKAASEMLNSKWASQTPLRAQRLSRQMETGVWQ
jgi:lysozyme